MVAPAIDFVDFICRVGDTVADGVDVDDDPELEWVTSGKVIVTAIDAGEPRRVADGSPVPYLTGIRAIELTFAVDGEGYARWRGKTFVRMADLTSTKVNPRRGPNQATHSIRFVDLKTADGSPVEITERNVRIAADTTELLDDGTGEIRMVCNIARLLPLAGGSPSSPVFQGPRGTSVEDVDQTAAASGDLVLQLSDGSSTTPVPLPAVPGPPGGVNKVADQQGDVTAAQLATALDDSLAELAATPGSALNLQQSAQTAQSLTEAGSPRDAADARVVAVGDGRYTRNSRMAVNLRDFGAVGNGVADDTAAFAAADAEAKSSGRALYIPSGTYLTSALPTLASGQAYFGDGQDRSIIRYTGSDTLITLSGKSRVKFDRLCITAVQPTARLIVLDASFRCTFTDCRLQGQHTAASGTTHYGQVGVDIINNAGDNTFLNCDILNFGIGLRTAAIMNFMIGGKIGTCHVGIYGGTGGGMSLHGMDFVSSYGFTPEVTAYNIQVPGQAGQWWIDGCWFEGADVGMAVGSTTEGPTQFNVTNCKIAATSKGIDLKGARQALLGGIQFSSNGAAVPVPLTIGAGALEGNAFGLVNITAGLPTDPFLTAFPDGVSQTASWTYLGRATVRLPSETRLPFNGVMRFTRSDGAVAGLMGLAGSSVVYNSVQTSAVAAAFNFRNNAGASIFQIDQPVSPVNQVGVVAGAAGTPVRVDARGTDTDIDLRLAPKGAGGVQIGTGAKIRSGSGAPTGSAGALGDFYLRTDTPGTANQRIYVCTTGGAAGSAVWAGIV